MAIRIGYSAEQTWTLSPDPNDPCEQIKDSAFGLLDVFRRVPDGVEVLEAAAEIRMQPRFPAMVDL